MLKIHVSLVIIVSAVLLAVTCKGLHNSNNNSVVISGNINKLENSTKISLILSNNVFINVYSQKALNFENQQVIQQEIKNNSFLYSIEEVSQPRNAIISYNKYSNPQYHIEQQFILEAGDSINITENKGVLKFTGRNSEKYNCEFQLNELKKYISFNPDSIDSVSLLKSYRTADSLAEIALDILESYKTKISGTIYSIEKSKIIIYFQSVKNSLISINQLIAMSDQELSLVRIRKDYLSKYDNPFWNQNTYKNLKGRKEIVYSEKFLQFLLYQYTYDSVLYKNTPFNLLDCLRHFTSEFKGIPRDWLIYEIMADDRLKRAHADEIAPACIYLLDSINIDNVIVRSKIKELQTIYSEKLAYDFSLPDMEGNLITQTKLKGKITLLDFWFIGCHACSMATPILDSIASLYDKNEFQVVSICVETRTDRDYKEDWKNAVKSGKYSSLKNVNLHALSPYSNPSPIIRHYDIQGFPSFFLIDKSGKLTEQPIDLRNDRGKTLIEIINKHNK